MVDAKLLLADVRTDLARLPATLRALLDGLDTALWRERPVADEWSPIEIVCHLRDEEAEDFGARVRVVVTGGDRFTPIAPERWAVERGYDRLRTTVTQASTGTLSGLDLLAAWVTHDRLHLAQLAGTLARLGARRWTPLRAEYAGTIPYGRP